jgi:hypothetical protein
MTASSTPRPNGNGVKKEIKILMLHGEFLCIRSTLTRKSHFHHIPYHHIRHTLDLLICISNSLTDMHQDIHNQVPCSVPRPALWRRLSSNFSTLSHSFPSFSMLLAPTGSAQKTSPAINPLRSLRPKTISPILGRGFAKMRLQETTVF